MAVGYIPFGAIQWPSRSDCREASHFRPRSTVSSSLFWSKRSAAAALRVPRRCDEAGAEQDRAKNRRSQRNKPCVQNLFLDYNLRASGLHVLQLLNAVQGGACGTGRVIFVTRLTLFRQTGGPLGGVQKRTAKTVHLPSWPPRRGGRRLPTGLSVNFSTMFSVLDRIRTVLSCPDRPRCPASSIPWGLPARLVLFVDNAAVAAIDGYKRGPYAVAVIEAIAEQSCKIRAPASRAGWLKRNVA